MKATLLRRNICMKRILFLLIIFCMGSMSSYAQRTINGVVSDAKGVPMTDVLVMIEGTNKGVTTNNSGVYSINVESEKVLVFSFFGCETKKVEINADIINVTMTEILNQLNEFVVIGYGSVKKKDILGSISSVKASDLEDRGSGNVIESMRGKVSGVKVTSSGQPGSNANINIRGIGSLTNNNPLFIIDGLYGGSELGINVEDVESIQILKDASSAAIYGSRAANGVVIITTKQGKSGKLKVKADAQTTINWLPRYDLMNAETYKKYDDRAYAEAMLAGVGGITGYQNHYDGNTDWQEEMLSTGMLQNYNVSLSGGSETLTYYTSLNRMIDKGALLSTKYDKYGFRVNSSGKKGIFSYGENFNYTKSNTKRLNGNPWAQFIGMPPTIPVYDESHVGGYGYGDIYRANSFGLNPVAMQDLQLRNNAEEYLMGNIYGQVSILKMIDAKLNIGYKSYKGSTDGLRKKGNWTMGQGDDAADVSFQSAQNTDILIEQTYSFKRIFGKHDVGAIVGMSYNKFHEEYRWITKLDPGMIGDKYITSLDAATGTTTAGGSYAESALISYMGRINYTYDDKYLAQVTARRDGTSRLPKDKRWGDFFSASVGWRISKEPFFNVDWISDLKIRANYGTLGNSSIGFWDYQSTINSAPRAIMGPDDMISMGKIQSKLTNNDITWERKITTNIGFDMTLFKNRLTVSGEYFYSKSKDLLVYLPILWTTGNEGGAPAVNAGSVSNKGFELELRWNDKIGDLNYYAGLNVSRVKNKVLSLGYNKTVHYTNLSKTALQQSLGMWYLYRMNGVFQDYAQIQNYVNSQGIVIQPDARPGDIIYDDFNDDGQISSEDRQIVGDPWPKFEMGLNFGLEYKGLSLDVSGYGRFGQMVYNGSAAAAGDFATNQNNFNGIVPWTQEHPVYDRPRIVYGDSRNSRADQDRWLEDGSFFRLSEITLAYHFPKYWLKKISIDDVRVSVTLQNLVTITKYSGLDPEFADGGIYTIGADNCAFPNPRAVQIGLSFSF